MPLPDELQRVENYTFAVVMWALIVTVFLHLRGGPRGRRALERYGIPYTWKTGLADLAPWLAMIVIGILSWYALHLKGYGGAFLLLSMIVMSMAFRVEYRYGSYYGGARRYESRPRDDEKVDNEQTI